MLDEEIKQHTQNNLPLTVQNFFFIQTEKKKKDPDPRETAQIRVLSRFVCVLSFGFILISACSWCTNDKIIKTKTSYLHYTSCPKARRSEGVNFISRNGYRVGTWKVRHKGMSSQIKSKISADANGTHHMLQKCKYRGRWNHRQSNCYLSLATAQARARKNSVVKESKQQKQELITLANADGIANTKLRYGRNESEAVSKNMHRYSMDGIIDKNGKIFKIFSTDNHANALEDGANPSTASTITDPFSTTAISATDITPAEMNTAAMNAAVNKISPGQIARIAAIATTIYMNETMVEKTAAKNAQVEKLATQQ